MTTYELQWGGANRALVNTAQELNENVRDIEGQRGDGGAPFQIVIVVADDSIDPVGQEFLAIGVGHPKRAFALWAGEGGGWGREAGVSPLTEDVPFDYAGQWTEFHPEHTCVMPETAKAVAREYISTGRRPTGLTWWDPDNEPADGAP